MPSVDSIAVGLSTRGLYYLCALLMGCVIGLAGLVLRVQELRLKDRATHEEKLREVQEARIQLAQTIIPVAKDLGMGAVALKAVARDLLDATPPRRRKPPPPEEDV